MSRKECVYCGALVSGRSRGDHMPIPLRNGGAITVDCCVSCHDMKDRFPVGIWPHDWWVKVTEDWPKLSRETRIFIAKAAFMLSDKIEERKA